MRKCYRDPSIGVNVLLTAILSFLCELRLHGASFGQESFYWRRSKCSRYQLVLSRTDYQGAIAKWLRRQIRNLFLFEGAGSNPAGVASFYDFGSSQLQWNRNFGFVISYAVPFILLTVR